MLRESGFTAFDIDRDNLAVPAQDNPLHWELNVSEIAHIKEARTEAASDNAFTFICGTVTNDEKYRSLFDTRITLVAGLAVTAYRLESRPDPTQGRAFGKDPLERTIVLERYATRVTRAKLHDTILIDSTQPPKTVADLVVASAFLHGNGMPATRINAALRHYVHAND